MACIAWAYSVLMSEKLVVPLYIGPPPAGSIDSAPSSRGPLMYVSEAGASEWQVSLVGPGHIRDVHSGSKSTVKLLCLNLSWSDAKRCSTSVLTLSLSVAATQECKSRLIYRFF